MAMPNQSYPRVTIPITSGYSSYIEMRGKALVGIEMPASWTAADITVKAKATNGSTGGVVYDDQGTQITIAADAGRYIRLDERLFQGCGYLAFAADGQAAARELVLVFRDEDELLGQGN